MSLSNISTEGLTLHQRRIRQNVANFVHPTHFLQVGNQNLGYSAIFRIYSVSIVLYLHSLAPSVQILYCGTSVLAPFSDLLHYIVSKDS